MNKRFINFYMDVAIQASNMSRAKRLKVGSIIVKDNNIISFSWNGTPAGWDNDCENLIGYQDGEPVYKTKPEVIHAEMNCLMKLAKSNVSGNRASMFITHAPCIECSKGIYQSGIKEVFYQEEYRSAEGVEFLKKCGVDVIKVTTDK